MGSGRRLFADECLGGLIRQVDEFPSLGLQVLGALSNLLEHDPHIVAGLAGHVFPNPADFGKNLVFFFVIHNSTFISSVGVAMIGHAYPSAAQARSIRRTTYRLLMCLQFQVSKKAI